MRLFDCVLWMPTVNYKDFQSPDEMESEIFEVSDSISAENIQSHDDNRLYVRFHTYVNNDIDIYFYLDDGYRYNKREDSLNVKLRHLRHSRNGMFVYSVETEQENHPVFGNSATGDFRFPCDIYHRIKNFYHEHSFHDDRDGDSVLKPYIAAANNGYHPEDDIMSKAVEHYLNLYDKRFSNGYKYMKVNYYILANSSFGGKLKFFFMAKRHLAFYKMASALNGDRIYLNTLLASSHNTFMTSSVWDHEDDVEESAWNQKRFNIDNIHKSIELMVSCVDNKLGISNAIISFWISVVALGISLYFGLKPLM